MKESITFYSDGLKIRGNLQVPRENAPCVVTLHGLEGDKDEGKWPTVAHELCKNGYACLRFNFRGCGRGKERSEGEFEDLTLTARIRDYKSALVFLQTSGRVDTNRVGVIGSSLGGMVAIAAEERRARAVVTLAAPCKIPRYKKPLIPKRKGEFYVLPSGRRFREDFYEDMGEYDLCKSVQKAPPILIIQGGSDEIVPLSHAQILFNHAKNPRKLEVIAGADHVFSNPKHLKKAIRFALEWFDTYL